MKAALDPAEEAWMRDGATHRVMRALTAEGGAARFVGGAVRNALLGADVIDIDIATPIRPEEAMRLLTKAGLVAVPTGLAHGTVTAVACGRPFEVTTLRRDVETDGRRAVVAFTEDWKEDAARRDFTINALYADETGAIYDYFGGLDDLAARRVRFVGDPPTRIREDYLRILRLFRFHAWYGRGDVDAEALAASIALRSGLKRLSGERIQKELLRLLEAPDPMPALATMEDSGILAEILPGRLQRRRLERLVGIEKALGRAPVAVLRLAALLPDSAENARAIAGVLRFSNENRDRLVQAASPDGSIAASLPIAELHKRLYRVGRGSVADQILLRWAEGGDPPDDGAWRNLLAAAEAWTKPRFPLDGEDAMRLGVEEGPRIGVLLREVEQWWIAEGFAPDRLSLLARLKEKISKH